MARNSDAHRTYDERLILTAQQPVFGAQLRDSGRSEGELSSEHLNAGAAAGSPTVVPSTGRWRCIPSTDQTTPRDRVAAFPRGATYTGDWHRFILDEARVRALLCHRQVLVLPALETGDSVARLNRE